MVQRIRSAGQSLLAILNDVLDLSKIEAGQLRIEPRPFDSGALLASLDSLMGQDRPQQGLDPCTSRRRPMRPGPLVGDGLRLEQVLSTSPATPSRSTEHGEVAVRVQTPSTATPTACACASSHRYRHRHRPGRPEPAVHPSPRPTPASAGASAARPWACRSASGWSS